MQIEQRFREDVDVALLRLLRLFIVVACIPLVTESELTLPIRYHEFRLLLISSDWTHLANHTLLNLLALLHS